jgi:hypothetical protein
MSKTIDSDQLSSLSEFIQLVIQMPDQYVALRLVQTDFIIAISPYLSKQQENKAFIPHLLSYVLRGFSNVVLTLSKSAFCFHMLCKDNAQEIAPFANEIAQ